MHENKCCIKNNNKNRATTTKVLMVRKVKFAVINLFKHSLVDYSSRTRTNPGSQAIKHGSIQKKHEVL